MYIFLSNKKIATAGATAILCQASLAKQVKHSILLRNVKGSTKRDGLKPNSEFLRYEVPAKETDNAPKNLMNKETQRDRELKMFYKTMKGQHDTICKATGMPTLDELLDEDPIDAYRRRNPTEIIHPDPEDYERDRAAVEEIGDNIKFRNSEDEAKYQDKHC